MADAAITRHSANYVRATLASTGEQHLEGTCMPMAHNRKRGPMLLHMVQYTGLTLRQ